MTPHPGRSTVLSLAVVALLAVAACGGGGGGATSPAATSGTGATTTQAPAATQDAGAPAASADAGGGIDLGAAAASLDNLDNYSFKIEMKAEGGAEGMMGLVKPGGSILMEGVLQLKPVEAADVTMTLSDGTTSTAIAYRIIGDKAYMNMGGDAWISVPADDAASTIESLKPGALLKGYATTDMPMVGEEEKNGVATIHYRSTADPGIGSMLGLPTATWTIETWVAKDGGFPIAGLIVAEGQNEAGEAGSFTVSVDVTGVNTPGLTIEAPENVEELPS